MRALNSLILAFAVAATSLTTARAADLLRSEPPPQYEENALVPTCSDSRVLGKVEDQFEHGSVHMLGTGVTIDEFGNLVEKAYFPRTDNSSVERRYCQGEVLLSDRERHTVYYVVSYPLGFASVGWDAEGCVLGLDKWYVYGANCSSLRRF